MGYNLSMANSLVEHKCNSQGEPRSAVIKYLACHLLGTGDSSVGSDASALKKRLESSGHEFPEAARKRHEHAVVNCPHQAREHLPCPSEQRRKGGFYGVRSRPALLYADSRPLVEKAKIRPSVTTKWTNAKTTVTNVCKRKTRQGLEAATTRAVSTRGPGGAPPPVSRSTAGLRRELLARP